MNLVSRFVSTAAAAAAASATAARHPAWSCLFTASHSPNGTSLLGASRGNLLAIFLTPVSPRLRPALRRSAP